MDFKPIILLTDAFIFFLLAFIIGYFYHVVRNKELRAKWYKLLQQPIAMACIVILLFYTTILIADCLHYQSITTANKESQSDEQDDASRFKVKSVLDKFIAPIGEHRETSYSKPFALYALSKESLLQADGSIAWTYPRLKYAGVNLKNDSEKWRDIAEITLKGSVLGISLSIMVLLLIVFIYSLINKDRFFSACYAIAFGNTKVCYRTLIITLSLLIIITTISLSLGQQYYIMGTDKVGSDVFYHTIKSIRTGMVIGTLTTLVTLPFALLLGCMAGYFRGWIDDMIQYSYTVLSSIPGVLLIAASVLTIQIFFDNHAYLFITDTQRGDISLFSLCVILGITSWANLCRLLRGETLKLIQLDFVQAAHVLGLSHIKIIVRHIMPNLMHIVVITVAMDFSGLVLAEAILSYVGIGVDASMNSWGNMINQARLELSREPVVWWSLAGAFSLMFMLVLSANLFADALRDVFDPHERGRE